MNSPWSIQVELTEGCNLMCDFCGIWSIRSKPNQNLKFMTVELADKVSRNLNNWIKRGRRIEFAMAGEPTLNPNCDEIISIFRENYPKSQLQMTTNGIKLVQNFEDAVKKFFDAGLNILVIDCYNNTKDLFLKLSKEFSRKSDVVMIDFYHEEANFHPYRYNSNKGRYIILFDDITIVNGKKPIRKLLNHAGNVDFTRASKYGIKRVDRPLSKRCSKVFRELVIKYDGAVPICCHDWKREMIIGKFPEKSLNEIWNSLEFNAVRQLLWRKNRNFAPCSRCDYNGGFRKGLLRDPKLNLSDDELIKIIEHFVYKKKNEDEPNTSLDRWLT